MVHGLNHFIVVWIVPICYSDSASSDNEHTSHLSLQDRMRHPVAFLAEMCGDIMYFAQAIKQPDRKQFVEAIVKEVNGHVENRNWELIKG